MKKRLHAAGSMSMWKNWTGSSTRREKGPLNEADRQKLKTAVHALVERLVRRRNTEKTNAVLGDQNSPAPAEETQPEESEKQTCRARPQWRERVSRRRKGKDRARRVCTPAIVVRTAGEAMSTNRKSRKCWCGSWARRRWPLRSMNWKDCAAMPAGRSSRRRSRKAWARRSTTKPLLR